MTVIHSLTYNCSTDPLQSSEIQFSRIIMRHLQLQSILNSCRNIVQTDVHLTLKVKALIAIHLLRM